MARSSFVFALVLVIAAMAATAQAGSSAIIPGAAAALRGVHGSRAPILRTCTGISNLQRLRGGAEEEEEEDLFADDDAAEAKTPKVHPGAAAAAAAAEEKAKNKPAAKTNVVLDVKGWDDETDLEAMEKGVRAIDMDGLFWGASGLEEVGYGIKKLRITCVVEDDKVSLDELEEKIRELEDYVQNVDIAAMQKI